MLDRESFTSQDDLLASHNKSSDLSFQFMERKSGQTASKQLLYDQYYKNRSQSGYNEDDPRRSLNKINKSSRGAIYFEDNTNS